MAGCSAMKAVVDNRGGMAEGGCGVGGVGGEELGGGFFVVNWLSRGAIFGELV